jgi:hypothetical protein
VCAHDIIAWLGLMGASQVKWAYKSKASAFDLLYMYVCYGTGYHMRARASPVYLGNVVWRRYGFVSKHPAHAYVSDTLAVPHHGFKSTCVMRIEQPALIYRRYFPLAVEWAGDPSTTLARRALALLRRISPADVVPTPTGLELTLRFGPKGLLPSTLGYCRVLALLHAHTRNEKAPTMVNDLDATLVSLEALPTASLVAKTEVHASACETCRHVNGQLASTGLFVADQAAL